MTVCGEALGGISKCGVRGLWGMKSEEGACYLWCSIFPQTPIEGSLAPTDSSMDVWRASYSVWCLNNMSALPSSTYENGVLSKQSQPLLGQLFIAQSDRPMDTMTTPAVYFLGTIMERRRGRHRIRPDPGIYGQAPDVYALSPEEDVFP